MLINSMETDHYLNFTSFYTRYTMVKINNNNYNRLHKNVDFFYSFRVEMGILQRIQTIFLMVRIVGKASILEKNHTH